MRTLLLLTLLLACVGCQAGGVPLQPNANATDVGASPQARSTADPAAESLVSAQASLQPTVEPIATTIPLVRATPVPIPTPVPLSAALMAATTSMETKLAALRTALRTQDVSATLRVQRDLLAACDQADAALKGDKSTTAQSVRTAITEIRSAASSGDNNGLDHAEAALRQVLGGGGLGVTATNATASPVTADLHTIQDQVRGLRQAIQSKNTGEAMRLQGQLLSELSVAQKAAADDDSDQGKTLRTALADLQKGLDGDATRLAAAANAFDKLGGTPDQPTVATDVPRVASSLGTKIDAFRAAASTGSRADLLRLQQEILADADQAAGTLTLDQSPTAVAVRGALADVRAGVSGDLSKLDGARSALAKAAGESEPASVAQPNAPNAPNAGKPIVDLKRYASNLDTTVSAFQIALQQNDTGTMLRLQRQLSDLASQADNSLKEAQSKPADEVRAAVASIRTAFAGDLTKLDEAHTHLRTVTGTTSQTAKATPTAGAQSDVPSVANSVRDSVSGLAMAVRDHQTADELDKRREALKADVKKAEAALNGVNDPRAERIRSALGVAREAAGGDDAKAANALTALEGALGGQ